MTQSTATSKTQTGSKPPASMAEIHKSAAKCHELAAEQHHDAAKHHADGNSEKSGQCATKAQELSKQAVQHEDKCCHNGAANAKKN